MDDAVAAADADKNTAVATEDENVNVMQVAHKAMMQELTRASLLFVRSLAVSTSDWESAALAAAAFRASVKWCCSTHTITSSMIALQARLKSAETSSGISILGLRLTS